MFITYFFTPMKSIYDKAKFKVTRNVLIFIFISMALLATVNFVTDGNNLFTASLGTIFSLIVIVFVNKTKTYKAPAFLAITLAYGLNFYNLLGESNFENYIDFFWIINIVLFSFFTLGRWVGNIYFIINIVTVISISFLSKEGVITLRPANRVNDFNAYIDFSINFIVCSIFFGYLINQFLKQSNIAQQHSIDSNIKLKQANSELQKQYDEKSVMLKEIHHRVKNNLQVITSLLRLQLYKLEDKKSIEPFEESISRVNAMALIHEKMYKGDQVKAVNLKQYIIELADNLITNYSHYGNIKVEVKTDIEILNLDTIVPLSLVLNELISNSLKHAFNGNSGKISINILKKGKANQMIYKDNGKWKPPKNPNSFGLELIETFTEQLGGTYTTNHDNGTEYIFEFEVYEQ